MEVKRDKPRGVLRNSNIQISSKHARYLPGPASEYFIEHYWTVSWDLRGREPYLAETLPHPSVHLVFERGNSRIQGIVEGRFSSLLKDLGRVWGIKFKPGMFYPFFGKPVRSITNDSVPIDSVFPIDVKKIETSILSADDDSERISIVEKTFFQNLPAPDRTAEWIGNAVRLILEDREIAKVERLSDLLRVNKRTLQRLFHKYVGVSPKWVIQRYRLHEAAERLEKGEVLDGVRLALELGYFDQAHFIRDFKSFVGKSPEQYSKNLKL
ncbi:AraC family transcriptional regulator [Leptospira ellisii]|uniref:AraC family transcriptional regulator n=2 Tax=Leptospira ellisii TaxID=2023197 RepID=A0AAE4QKW8_9LEPT|nr:AraC family transcriptional regulator [Leptospira ellisii]MDV6234269.1 AraC family transcriptional regulator [Leptospira ellisii]PKA05298.1 AraC family transcriptional regulator [Leptospira ellisii]